MKKRLLACLLILSLFVTGLGFVPAAQAAEDGIIAQWTSKENLVPADQEVILQPDRGALSNESFEVGGARSQYEDSDIVTVIVELEEAPLLEWISGDVAAFAASAQGAALEQELRKTQDEIKSKLQTAGGAVSAQSVNGASGLEYSYTTVLNGFSTKLRYGDLEKALALDGVKRIFVAERYSLPEEQSSEIFMANSSGMVGASAANALGYDGTGTIVAIGDSGIDSDHEAFSVMPTDGKYTKEDISALLSANRLSSGVTNAEDVYISEKIPYGYDYADGDTNAEAVGESHGVHVAGTVAGNNGVDFFGVAPNAQLMIMKVFSDGSGSTSDDIILAGIDDAVKLGADAVNLSLGSPAGFAEYGDEDEEETDSYLTYAGVYSRALSAGVNILIAAGNETASTKYNPYGNDLTLSRYPDNGIVGSPSTLPAALSVASVGNVAYESRYLMLDGQKLAYTDSVNNNTQLYYNFLDTFDGQTVAYVPVPGLGNAEDFQGLDLTGKLALISRGSINFDLKAANAAAAGAAGVIIYDNVYGSLGAAALENYTIPVIMVSKESGALLLSAEAKEVSFSSDYYGSVVNPAGGQMSSFSSKGPAPDLSIKPEITAPGGNIYSSVIGGGYQTMSGTSMATPHMAGISAVLRQYLQEEYGLSGAALAETATSLLMSTAIPALDQSGDTYFSVRRQGAGVANVYNAMVSGNYLTVEDSGRPKAELGSSPDGSYSFTMSVHNLDGSSKTYTVDTAALAELTTETSGLRFASNVEKRLSADEIAVTYTGLTGGKVTVPAGGTATFTVTMALTGAGKTYLEENFENGSYVEGFVFLTPDDGVTLSAPFLGFYGDWETLEVFDADPSGVPNMLGTALADMDNTGYGYFLGMNGETYDSSKLAYAPQRGNRQLISRVSLLRNVTSFEQTVTDEEDNVIFSTGDLGWARKTYAAVGYTGIQYTAITYTPGWFGRTMKDGVNDAGDWAESGKWYTYSIMATPVGSETPQTKSFRVYLDNEKPALRDVELYAGEDDQVYLTFLVSDDFYVNRVRVIDSTQEYYYLMADEEFGAVQEPGAETRVTFNVTDLAAELAAEGKNPGRVGLLLEDMAYNQALTFVDLGPQSMTLISTSVEVGASKQMEVSIKPERMADTALTWASDDVSVATVDENGIVTGVSDGVATISATAISGLTAYARVTVGKGVPVLLTYGEAPELNDRFQTDDGFCWKVTGPDTVQLVAEVNRASQYAASYVGMSGDLVIPDTVEYGGKTFRVTSIGYQAFYMNTNLTSVTIPEGVTNVGYSAFFICSQITNFNLPDSLEYVDTYAFNTFGKPAFDKIPANLKWIGESAFQNAQIDSLDLPEGLEHIGTKAFMSSSVKSASIPESVTEYGADIFLQCSGLSYVELPENMTEIPENMFYYCTGLKRIQIPAGVTKIGDGAFYGSGLEKLTIPSSVKEIGEWSFAWLTNMREINIPDTVETVGFNAYIYAQGVKTVNIGSGVKAIGQDGFRTWNLNLGEAPVMNVKTEATAVALRRSGYGQEILLNGVPYTGYNGAQFSDGTFSYMPTSDTEVQVIGFNTAAAAGEYTMPAEVYCEGDDRTYTVTSVKSRVFFQNQNILKLNLPDTLESVGERAFDQMFNVTEFNVPQNLKEVGYQAMGYLGWDAKSLGLTVKTDYTLEIPGTVVFWDDCGFSGNLQESITVGEGVEYIGDYGLSACKNATSVTLPSTLKRINNAAFQSCSSLTSIDIPDSVTYIGDSAFSGVPLESIELPEGLKYIGRSALGAYAWNSDYTAQSWVGPAYIELNGQLDKLGYNAFRPDAEIVAVLNSQRNLVVEFSDMEKLPTVIWDGKTDIPFNDGSYVPEGTELHLTKNVTVDGKLTVDGKIYVPHNVYLEITEDAVIVNPENIVYEACPHKNTAERTVPATCTEPGSVTVTCEDCGLELSVKEIPALGHSPERKNAKEANCAESGYTGDLICTVCGEILEKGEIIPASCPSEAFADLDTGRWYHEYTDYVIRAGLMQGVSNTRFAPNGQLTRGMLVTTLYRLADEPAVQAETKFVDVPQGRYFAQAVAWAEAEGIAKGVTATTFEPDRAVSREQAATFLYRYVTEYLQQEPDQGADLSVYRDASKISAYAEAPVAWATAAGLFEGFPGGTFQPQGILTRAQMAKLLAVLDRNF